MAALSYRFLPSPYFDQRPAGSAIDLLVVHAISLPPGCFGGSEIDELFLGQLSQRDWGPIKPPFYEDVASLRVSAHFLIDRQGRLTQYVPIAGRAWHAGVSEWQGRSRCNDFSIGVELEGDAYTTFETIQYQRLATLIRTLHKGLQQRGWGAIPPAHIAGHEQIAPGRKWDPGPFFEWEQLWQLTTRARAARWPLVWA
ncbi:1,6-anhydro-N-acetylmuramyl-L-alanine amidase AmpD [Candidatus Magnetaquicoccus inordinatus]|uniref:1,6-anhydro-N-acetylmuramyl-L-alanine amidase AmpD n=1 Tax=Candidatus Magnetaquicoccus inordinatus TaxID=2496818 RepID=UPI00102CCE0D|nr:1,6-anhydro-N-acetylmuramyl-L-alanine amidase AmpD [Candidatus Magnetaquicoccus inordinatus]